MMNKFGKLMTLLVMTLSLASCEKDATTAGQISYVFKPANLAASVGTTAAGSGLVVVANSNGSMTWTTGTVNIQKIEFSAKRDQIPASIDYSNLTSVDILNSGTVSGTVNLPSGTYDGIEVRLKLIQSTSNAPLVLKGNYTETSGTKIPVEIQFNDTYDLKVMPPQIVVKNDKYTADITLDLTKMMTGLTASDLGQTSRVAPNNTILVSSSANAVLYAKLKANLLLVPSISVVKQ